jgi:hypothetical protein
MEHSHIRVKKSYAATSRRRDTCLLEMHQLSATTMRSSTLFKFLESTEEEEELEEEELLKKRSLPDDEDDVNVFSSVSRKRSRIIFHRDEWVIDRNDTNCGIHPWLTNAVVTDILVTQLARDDMDLVARMLAPSNNGLKLSYVQGITCHPSQSSGMDPFTVYPTRYLI